MMNMVTSMVAWAQRNELPKWFDDVEAQMNALEKASTPDEKKMAAKGISDLIHVEHFGR